MSWSAIFSMLLKFFFQISELMAENARLAGELLKEQSRADEGNVQRKDEVEELLKERDEIWRSKEESLREEQRQELAKLKDEFERRLQQHDEKWMKRSREQLEDLEKAVHKVKLENLELRSENERLKSEMKQMLESREQDERFAFHFLVPFSYATDDCRLEVGDKV